MRKEKGYTGMTIRVPLNIAKEIKKLKEDKDLSTYGLALQYWIRAEREHAIDLELFDTKNEIENLIKAERSNLKQIGDLIRITEKIVDQNKEVRGKVETLCSVIQLGLGSDSPWPTKLRSAMGCKKCPVEGYIKKSTRKSKSSKRRKIKHLT